MIFITGISGGGIAPMIDAWKNPQRVVPARALLLRRVPPLSVAVLHQQQTCALKLVWSLYRWEP